MLVNELQTIEERILEEDSFYYDDNLEVARYLKFLYKNIHKRCLPYTDKVKMTAIKRLFQEEMPCLNEIDFE